MLVDTRTDALGLRQVKLDWRLTELDKQSVRRALQIFAAAIGRLEIGRMKILLSDDDDTTWPDDLEGANHHLGTTRMHDDPHEGVVDSNCKVHGIDNLYVAVGVPDPRNRHPDDDDHRHVAAPRRPSERPEGVRSPGVCRRRPAGRAAAIGAPASGVGRPAGRFWWRVRRRTCGDRPRRSVLG